MISLYDVLSLVSHSLGRNVIGPLCNTTLLAADSLLTQKKMKIGLDFDNTIARYETLFRQVAQAEGLISGNWKGGRKTKLRNHLCRQADGERTWMKLQGLVYGKYMHGAEMMPGIANFLLSCKVRNHRVFIVSHKTEYGHFDPEKISLRQEALQWMEAKHFFDQDYFAINRGNVFFADTQEEKVAIIAQLKCNWFIDDLPEVFEQANFPLDTRKILFGGFSGEKLAHDSAVLDSWRKISDKILGQTTDDDILSWSRRVVDKPIKQIEQIPGRGNSQVYKIISPGGKIYALKNYPDLTFDSRRRLETEFNALRMLHHHNITNVPKAVKKDDDLNLGLYGWIEGETVSNPSADDLGQAINFVEKLHSLSRKIDRDDIEIASEACLSAKDLTGQIEKRLLRLKSINKNFPKLWMFLDSTFEPLWAKVRGESCSLWPFESKNGSLPRGKQTLSQSDFGFHNTLQVNSGVLTFIDFEYFGWDDPVKLTADFIWHPAMKLNPNLTAKWKEAMLGIFGRDSVFEDRLNAALPLYGLRWTMIVLNEFLPDYAERRKNAGETASFNIEKRQEVQLKKAERYCKRVEELISPLTVV